MLSQTHRIVEALLFTAEEPLTEEQVRVSIGEEIDLTKVIDEIKNYYEKEGSPLTIKEVANGYRMVVRKEYDPWIRRLYQKRGQLHLTRSSLETLAIIAYKQPITKIEIDSIRGVNSDGPISSLLEKKLIEIKGRKQVPGRPLLYGTTKKFLEYFGLKSLNDLPDIKQIDEITQSALFDSDNKGK
ncbi:MAG: SMC-Scp complex subunit ScpB [Candidatus Marinimicrobia bacterium]|nr:SMC-Scp complex subunit ScpB [Candidatus Neomarinimicrobiota bacterium]